MSSNTPNLGLLKKDPMVDGNETFNIETMLNDNWDKIDEAVGQSGGYGVTTQPAANAYEVTLSPAPTSLAAGLRVTIKADTASTGAPTLNVNGLGAKAVFKASGNPASFKANGVYTLVYDGTAFILQGEGGEVGTATAGDVLEGKTFPGEDGLIAGTMPDRSGAESSPVKAERSWNGAAFDILVTPQKGYHSGAYPSVTKVVEPNFKQENIRAGVNFMGAPGAFTEDASATAADILTGKTAGIKGSMVSGTMPYRSAENHHMPGIESTVWSGDRFFIRPPQGFYNGATWVTAAVPGLTANNLRAGVNVAGLVGTLDPSIKMARAGLGNNHYGSITNLPFKPILLIIQGYYDNGNITVSGACSAYFNGSTVEKITDVSSWAASGGGMASLNLLSATFGSNFVNFELSYFNAQARGYIVFGV